MIHTAAKYALATTLALVLALPVLAQTTGAGGQPLAGQGGSSSRWGSGWLALATTTDFAKGDRLRLTIGGTAAMILVRLLPKGRSPDSTAGIVGGAIKVPEGRVVEVTLQGDRKAVIQISVHGGPNPWNKQLGGGNGPATLESASLIRNQD